MMSPLNKQRLTEGRRTVMATVRTNCPTCGLVDLSTEWIRIQPGPVGHASTFTFSCPGCGKLVAKAANLGLLRFKKNDAARIKITNTSSPSTKVKVRGPAFTYDDLLDFHFQLDSDAEIAGFFEDPSP